MSAPRPVHSISRRLRGLRSAAEARMLARRLAGRRLLRAFADDYPRASFVEIGSNDGKQHDHLRPFILTKAWTGIMVEPVPYVFERLQANYAGVQRVALENAAIADRDGPLPFYRLLAPAKHERDRLPAWYDGIGSFSRAAVLSHVDHIPDIHRRIVREEVPCLTFESLCLKHRVRRVDLLVVDTEGYDFEVLRNIDLEQHRPRLVVYEHFHLSPADRAACRARLHEVGYETMEEGFDTWSMIPVGDDRLTRTWRRLTPATPGVSVHDPPTTTRSEALRH